MSTMESRADSLAVCRNIIIHSGNIASWNKLRKKGVLTSTAELLSAIEASFKSWLGTQNDSPVGDSLLVSNSGLCARVTEQEKQDVMFTLKIYLTHWESQDQVLEAVETTLRELGLTSVNSLILAFPPCPLEELTLSRIQPLWSAVETLVSRGVSADVGTADLDKTVFEQLYNWAAVKPTVNQVNLAHCCTMPEDLVAFAKANNVRLMTHNDDSEILPVAQLQTALDSTVSTAHAHWKPSWVTKYTSIIRLRGIIAHKGYLVNLSTSNN